MKNICRVLISIIIFSCISACQSKYCIWIVDNNCSSPCWNEIIPGETQISEALESLNNNTEIAPATIRSLGPWYIFDDHIVWSFRKGGKGELYVQDNIINMISFSLSDKLRFEDAVRIFGKPDYIYNSPGQADFEWNNIHVIYPERGILFGYSEKEIKKSLRDEISPEIPIGFIVFYDTNQYEQFIDARLFGHLLTEEEFFESLQPWNGYGKIPENYPDLIAP